MSSSRSREPPARSVELDPRPLPTTEPSQRTSAEAEPPTPAALDRQVQRAQLLGHRIDPQRVQRAMGFEFESGRNKVEGEGRKFLVYEDAQYTIEADTKEDVEFVTKPFARKSQVSGAVAAAAAGAQGLVAAKNAENKVVVAPGGGFRNAATLKINDDSFYASAQSTEGVRLEDLAGLIEEHIGGRRSAWSRDDADKVLAGNTLGLSAATEAKLNGLIQYMALYVRQVKDRNDAKLSSQDGPKAAFRLMARSDFNSMFRSLLDSLGRYPFQQIAKTAQIRQLVRDRLPGELEDGMTVDDYVFTRGSYLEAGDGAGRERVMGPKLGEWIDSVFSREAAKDVMSPPAGYAAHDTLPADERYGMGAYGMDGDKALVEMRGHRNKLKAGDSFGNVGGKIPRNQWQPFAEAIFDRAAARNTTLDDDTAAADDE